ncbi:syndetin [Octopus bimaculoides]|uniref:syndetin n=1 Tax=Octopus bimaculoides TaxID=37653 RepID=UPI00071D0469|nr:syndetin [Octopus bimaculoides]|eukprot:XP_014777198.1 PREDICTED: syndetin-like [Octopus bimaculoides]
MDIKKKLKLLIGKQDSIQSPTDEAVISPQQLSSDPAVTKSKAEQFRDPHVDQEILESIESFYYNSEQFDTSEYELKKLPETLELSQIDADRARLRGQLDVVSRKVYELVLQNHPAYVTELQRVMELQKTLQSAGGICTTGRSQLLKARESFTATSLGLLANYRKRSQLMSLLKSLHTIKTLVKTSISLSLSPQEEDYSGAIQLCLECQNAASTFRHYHCISELNFKLQDTLELIEEQLDVALSKTCNSFDVAHYSKVQTAYRLLGKTQVAMDQLHMHYTSAIHNTAFTIVLGYVELYSGTTSTNFQKKQYSDLCKHITVESFTPCLTDLCKALWEVMKCHYKTMLWHKQHNADTPDSEPPSNNEELSFNQRYVQQKLQHGMLRIWQDVQQKVKTFILGTDLSFFKFEEFILVLDLVNRLIEIGEEFCGSKSESLQDVLRQQSLNYFRNHHRSRMDELRMFLENEGWELCPVRSNFNLLQLLEFRFMQNWNLNTSSNSSMCSGNQFDTKEELGGYFSNLEEKRNPFDLQLEEDEQEDVFARTLDRDDLDGSIGSDSDSDVADELKQEFVDEHTGDMQTHNHRPRARSRSGLKSVAIVTNTSLNILRVIGRYMKMMNILKPIAFDVISCMSQLFDYYMYSVYIFFSSDGPEINDITMKNRLKITLQRVGESLIADGSVSVGNGLVPPEKTDKIRQAYLSPTVNLTNPQKLFGLSERIVAAESLVFLAEQFEFLQPYLDSMIPVNKKAFLQQFYSQTVKMASELRKPIYRVVSSQVIDYGSLVQQMSAVKWDVKDIMSQHNTYVDSILESFQDFRNRLHEVSRHVPVSKVVHDIIWEHCISLANHMFVEGYANAKKCTNEGRAWMQLDFQQFLTKLEKFADIRPIPEREYVETYIKAYYLPEAQLEIWLQDHKEYSNKQLLALITSVDHINRKARQRLVNMVEEFDKTRR